MLQQPLSNMIMLDKKGDYSASTTAEQSAPAQEAPGEAGSKEEVINVEEIPF